MKERVARKGIVLRRGEGQVSVVLSNGVGSGQERRFSWRNVGKRVTENVKELRGRFEGKRRKESWGFVALCLVVLILFVGTVHEVRNDDHVDAFGTLPYPLNIVKEVRKNRGLNWTAEEGSPCHFETVGYANVRPGTFRDVDTSKEDHSRPNRYGAFDEIYVVTNEKCSQQMMEFSERAHAQNLKFTKVVLSLRDLSLEHPPMPIVMNTSLSSLSAVQRVGNTDHTKTPTATPCGSPSPYRKQITLQRNLRERLLCLGILCL